jgi:hypothetical protein
MVGSGSDGFVIELAIANTRRADAVAEFGCITTTLHRLPPREGGQASWDEKYHAGCPLLLSMVELAPGETLRQVHRVPFHRVLPAGHYPPPRAGRYHVVAHVGTGGVKRENDSVSVAVAGSPVELAPPPVRWISRGEGAAPHGMCSLATRSLKIIFPSSGDKLQRSDFLGIPLPI